MKIKGNVSVYSCEFCKRKMFVKHAMVKHEHLCNSNPENLRACVGCQYLENTTVEYYIAVRDTSGDLDEVRKETNGFRCKKLEKMLYPFKAEKKGLIEKYPETFEGQEPMPKTCEHYKNEYELDIFLSPLTLGEN